MFEPALKESKGRPIENQGKPQAKFLERTQRLANEIRMLKEFDRQLSLL